MAGVLTSSKILHQPSGLVRVDPYQPYGAKTIYLALGNALDVDLVHGQNLSISPGTQTIDQRGIVRSFNGAQQLYRSFALPNGDVFPSNVVIAARVRSTAAQASTPGQAFCLDVGSGTQSAIGVGFDSTGTKVGAGLLTGNGTYLYTYSNVAIGDFHDVYVTMTSAKTVFAWIDGIPASTGQGSSAATGWNVSGWNELCIGAQHRSSGYLRQFKGDIEWASILYYPEGTFTDQEAFRLYTSKYPYSCIGAD